MSKITLAAVAVLALAACDDFQDRPPAAPAPVAAPMSAPTSAPGAELAENDPVRAEVQAVLDPRLTHDLGQPAKIKVEIMRGEAPWVMVSGPITTPSGGEIDFATTPLAQAAANGMMDGSNVIALLKKPAVGAWTVVEIHVGPTDVPQAGWPAQYHVSPAFAGMEEAEGGDE